MTTIDAPICLNDIIRAAIDTRGTKPKPLSLEPGEAPMRAIPILVNVSCGGSGIVLHSSKVTLIPGANLMIHAELPETHCIVEKSELDALRLHHLSAIDRTQVDQAELPSEPETVPESEIPESSEEAAIRATRAENGLPVQPEQSVFTVNPEAAQSGLRAIMKKPAVQPDD